MRVALAAFGVVSGLALTVLLGPAAARAAPGGTPRAHLAPLLAAATSTTPPPAARLSKPPKLVELLEAAYPEDLAAAGLEGVVGLWLDVDATGAVTRVELAEPSIDARFDAAAETVARRFRFEAAEAEGLGPVPVRVRYRYRFVLRAPTVATSSTSTRAAAEPPPPVPPITLVGTVLERGARTPVQLASIVVTSTIGTLTSTEADVNGRFALRGVPAGTLEVRVSAPYFAAQAFVEQRGAREQLEVLYFLERVEKNPFEVTVRARPPRREVARRTIELEELRRVPGAQGDAVRVIQNLPGVARTPFGLGLLVVRGAPPQSTGVFVDGHRIPLLFHFGGVGGVTSVVNSRTLDSIDFLPGGYSPRLGRITGGAVELNLKEPEKQRLRGEAQVDFLTLVPINASVFVEGPVSSDPNDGAFMFSLRRSSIDGVLALATELLDASVALAPRYYDYQARYSRPLGSASRTLSVTAYGSDDELVLVGAPTDGANAGGPTGTRSRTFFHRLNPKLTLRDGDTSRLVISPIFGVDFTDTQTSGSGANSSFSARLANLSAGVRVDGETRLLDGLVLRGGVDLLFSRYQADTVLPSFQGTKDFPSPIAVDRPVRRDQVTVPTFVASAYVEAELSLIPGLKLWPGLRVDGYGFQAEDQPLVDPRLVEGRAQLGVDPRITARYQLHEKIALKGQAGLYRQPPLPPQIYVNADLPLERAQQYSGGVEWQLVDKLSLDLVGFYRSADQVPRQSDEVEVVDGRVRPVGLRPEGQQRSYGLEVLLRLEKRWGLSGWIAYTLSRAEFRRDDGVDDWDPNFIFDQTHNLNVVGVYELALDWNLGVRFRYVTGGGVPGTSARWFDADADAYRRSTDGALLRAPPFHQLDVYVEKRWVFDQWSLLTYLDVQNVYNQTNTEAFVSSFDFKRTEALPGIPFFPSIGLRATF